MIDYNNNPPLDTQLYQARTYLAYLRSPAGKQQALRFYNYKRSDRLADLLKARTRITELEQQIERAG
jgi:hypothetical protein